MHLQTVVFVYYISTSTLLTRVYFAIKICQPIEVSILVFWQSVGQHIYEWIMTFRKRTSFSFKCSLQAPTLHPVRCKPPAFNQWFNERVQHKWCHQTKVVDNRIVIKRGFIAGLQAIGRVYVFDTQIRSIEEIPNKLKKDFGFIRSDVSLRFRTS